jgi:hypothetical protein
MWNYLNLTLNFYIKIYKKDLFPDNPGVPFVQVPTTLLAMVDSSIGGTTAAVQHTRTHTRTRTQQMRTHCVTAHTHT